MLSLQLLVALKNQGIPCFEAMSQKPSACAGNPWEPLGTFGNPWRPMEPMGILTSEGHKTTYSWIKSGVNWQTRWAKWILTQRNGKTPRLNIEVKSKMDMHEHGSPVGQGSGFQCLKPSSSFCLFKQHLNTGRHVTQREEWIFRELEAT